jgi:hypothetical protein
MICADPTLPEALLQPSISFLLFFFIYALSEWVNMELVLIEFLLCEVSCKVAGDLLRILASLIALAVSLDHSEITILEMHIIFVLDLKELS